MEKKKISKSWKVFGDVILIVLVLLVIFDITVWAVYKVQRNKYTHTLRQAREAGYYDSYDVCTRQDNLIIDGKEYVFFEAHREVILDGDYYENLIVSVEDEYIDKYPDEKGNLEIYAKELGFVYDSGQERYTIIDIYMIDLCREQISSTWCWRAFGVSIIVGPIILIAGLVWLIGLIVHKKRNKIDA